MPNTPPALLSMGNISPCRFVMIDTTAYDTLGTATGATNLAGNRGKVATSNAKIIGIIQEGANSAPLSDTMGTVYAAKSGQTFRLYGDGDICLLEMGETCTAGDYLIAGSGNTGLGAVAASTGTTIQRIGAIALQACYGANEKIQVQVHISETRPALS